jgi:phosphatidate cytidylyltransferase
MKRVLTALVLIPVVLYLVIMAPSPVASAVIALVGIICYREYASIAEPAAGKLGPAGYAAGIALLALDAHGVIFLTVVTLIAMSLAMRCEDLAQSLTHAGATLLGVIYIFGTWKCAILLREQNEYWLLFALAINWVGDIAAYYVGKGIGRHHLAPRVSPAKTWEGSAGSIAASMLFGFFYLRNFFPETTIPAALALPAAANIAGQFGDLAESALKRGAGVKDSGAILPGHGGLLDRVDSTLFTLPVVYVYLLLAH